MARSILREALRLIVDFFMGDVRLLVHFNFARKLFCQRLAGQKPVLPD
jgi:hypothetical protein